MSANIRLLLLIAAIGGGCLSIWKLVDVVAAGRVTKAIDTQNREDREDADAAVAARAGVRACYDGGGVWDRAEGRCQRVVPGARQ